MQVYGHIEVAYDLDKWYSHYMHGVFVLFIENQAFSPSYNLAPPPHPLPSASCLSFSVFQFVTGRTYWRKMGEGGGGGAKSFDNEKAWYSVNHSILSGYVYSC